MIRIISARYAGRSLFRHTRRTLLSMLGVGVGCGIAIIALSWVGGTTELQIRAVSHSGAGHLRIVPNGWMDTRENTLRLADWQSVLEEVNAFPGVEVAVPRARATGLLAFGNRTAPVELVGVDPEAEPRANRLVSKAAMEGRYLEPGDEGTIVLGRAIANRLRVRLDDDLFVTLACREEIQSAMLRIVGIVDTGNSDMDLGICQSTLADIERITGYDGPGEVTIILDDWRLIEEARTAIAARIGDANTVVTWKDVNPALAGNVDGDAAFMRLTIAIVVGVVIFGIASAQLTAVLERRREFATLTALGMKARTLVALIALEAVFVGLGGALAALVFGGGCAYLLHTIGVSFEALLGGEDLSFAGILLDARVYGEFGAWIIYDAVSISLLATVSASLYPAWLATRVDPARALRTT